MPPFRYGLAAAAALCANGAQADNYIEFAWNGGSLSEFLEQNKDAGIGIPLIEPHAILIGSDVAHLADIGLVSQSLVTLTDGRLDLSAPGYTNRPEGLFVADRPQGGVLFVVATPGLAEAPVFSNEGRFIVTPDTGLQINTVKVVNLNGGIIDVGPGASITTFNADIRDGSRFTGPGIAQIKGRMSGAITSESSLSLGNGTTVADDAMIDGLWSWQYVSRLEGTTTNLGVVRGHQFFEASLGTLAAGGRFVNEGTVSGGEIGLAGNDTDASKITEFVNNGLVQISGFRLAGTAPGRFVNNGRLELRGSLLYDNLHFHNSGTIDVASGLGITIAGPSASRPLRSLVFRDGTRFTGGGTTTLTGNIDFSGLGYSENLRLTGSTYRGDAAMLSGVTRWNTGNFSGHWTNLGELDALGTSSTRGIADVFGNLGQLTWRGDIALREGAVLTNHGTFGAGATSSSVNMRGTADGVEELVMNFGRLLEQGGGRTGFYGLRFVNLGLIEIRDGGRVDFSGATLENLGSIIGNGELRVGANGFVNEGLLAPGLSPGNLTIAGNFTNGERGVVELEMASASVFDVLRVTGTATLGGTLRIRLLDGYVPSVGDAFRFLFAEDDVTGSFASIVLDGYTAAFSLHNGGRVMTLGIESIAPVPLPPAVTLLGGALGLLWLRHRRRANAPGIPPAESLH